MTARPARPVAAPRRLPRAAGRRGRLGTLALLVVLVGAALAGCSGGGSSSSSGAAAGGVADGLAQPAAPQDGAAAAPDAQRAAGSAGSAGSTGSAGSAKGSTSGSTAVAPPRLVMTATLRLQVDDVTRRASDIRAVAQGAGGSVTQEDLTSSADGTGSAPEPASAPTTSVTSGATSADTGADALTTSGTMTVQVPQARLDGVLDQLAGLGTVLQRTTSSQDVTSTYVDTSSRVATMQASVARLRALLAGAKDLGQVVALEDELTKREADLESTQAQLADLQGRTTMATVSLSLSTPSPADASTTPSGSPGFADGLRGGWHAFVAVVAWLLTALGAVLPFVALAAAVTLPVVAWRRRRTSAAEETAAAGDPGAPAVPEEEKRPTVTS